MIDCAKSVVFRVDANRRIGQGHLHRCLTLARHLREKGFRITLLTYGRSSSLVKKYEEEFSVLWLEDAMLDNRFGEFPMDWEQDALSTIQTMKRNGIEFAWMVVDNYNLDAKWERKVREQGHKILAIDDFRNRPHNAEIIVSDSVKDFDQGLLENAQRTCILKGPKFALVDKEFACDDMGASWNSSPRSILISYGSSDDTNETRKALQAIEDIRLDSQNGVFVGRVDVGLGHVGVLRADDVLAVLARSALPWHVARRIHARRLDQLLVEVAVGAFQRAHEGPFLRPALPALVLFLFFALAREIVAGARFLVVEAGHLALQSTFPRLGVRDIPAAVRKQSGATGDD